jgi:hypothetical protein
MVEFYSARFRLRFSFETASSSPDQIVVRREMRRRWLSFQRGLGAIQSGAQKLCARGKETNH